VLLGTEEVIEVEEKVEEVKDLPGRVKTPA